MQQGHLAAKNMAGTPSSSEDRRPWIYSKQIRCGEARALAGRSPSEPKMNPVSDLTERLDDLQPLESTPVSGLSEGLDDLLTSRKVSEMLGIGVPGVNYLYRQGQLPGEKKMIHCLPTRSQNGSRVLN